MGVHPVLHYVGLGGEGLGVPHMFQELQSQPPIINSFGTIQFAVTPHPLDVSIQL